MLKCTVKIDEKLQREINERSWIINLVIMIIGAIGLGVYIVVGTFIKNEWLNILLWVFAVMFAFGLTMIVTIRKINKKSAANGYVDEIEIEEDCINITTKKNDEIISTLKTYHKDLQKIRETENYLILQINKQSAIPIPKNSFSAEELSTIKLWVNSAKK